jgi:3,4-dihydroxy 2-butanone 4-phosphate synthase / GTP cyclohydrolase II
VETQWGSFTGYAYSTLFDSVQHIALVHGRIGDGTNIPVRLHRANALTDVFEGGKTVNAALQRFVKEGRGVLVYLRDGTAGVPTTSFSEHEETGSEAMRTSQGIVNLSN